jgi:hypothetical protein
MDIILIDTLTMTFCLFIVICFIVAFIYLYKKTAPITREIDAVNKALAAIKHKPEFDESGEQIVFNWDPTSLTVMYQNYEQMDKLISSTVSLKKQWRDYRRSMQEPGKDFTLSPEAAPILRNTIPTKKVFSFSEVLDTLINVRFLTSVPSKLTGLGLLFTFIGLIMGISEAAVGLGSNDIDAAKQALNPLLNGASIAFTTSVVGLALAMIFSFIEKNFFHKLNIILADFGDLINERVEFVDADKLASMQLQATQLQTKALADFQFDQQRITNETITRVCHDFREALTESAGTELTQLANIISQVTDRFATNLKGFENNQNIVQESTNKLAMQLDETIEKLQLNATQNTTQSEASFSRITANFEKSMEKSGVLLNQGHEKIQDSTDSLVNQFKAAIVTLEENSEEKISQVEASFSRMETSFEKSMQLSRESFVSGNTEIQISTSQLVKQLDESVAKLQENSEKNTNQVAASFSRMETSFESSVQLSRESFISGNAEIQASTSQLVKHLDESIIKLQENSEKSANQIEGSFTRIGAGIEESMLKSSDKIRSMTVDVHSHLLAQLQDTTITAMDEFITNTTTKLERSLATITEGIHDNESPLKSLIEQIPLTVKSLVKVNASVVNTFKGLDQAQDAMGETLERAKNVAYELTQSSVKLIDSNTQALEAREGYSQMISAAKSVSESGTKSAASVEKSVAHLLQVFEKQRSHGDQLGIAMSSLFDDLERGMLSYSAQTNKYMEGLDKHTAGISKHLVEAINELRLSLADLNTERLSEVS